MTRLEFGEWVWSYYNDQDDEIKAHLEEEIIGEGWLFRQPAKEQLKVLEGAPESFVNRILRQLKPEVAINLGHNPYLKAWKERR